MFLAITPKNEGRSLVDQEEYLVPSQILLTSFPCGGASIFEAPEIVTSTRGPKRTRLYSHRLSIRGEAPQYPPSSDGRC